jgi:NAD/NADP transhydrogenase alpha subunit
MFIGVPKEIKADEYRVGLIPSTVRELAARGHSIEVETSPAMAQASAMPSSPLPAQGSWSAAGSGQSTFPGNAAQRPRLTTCQN